MSEVLSVARDVLAAQERDGVVAVADITNTGLTRELADDFFGELLCFKEYLGLRAAGVEPALQALDGEGKHCCTAHAPYSTHADLLLALKKRAAGLDHVFPLHVAEPPCETEMICRGRGELPDFLRRRGFWDGSFQPTGIDKTGSVLYLHQLGILDHRTLCVHCIHVSNEEIELLHQNGCGICLCPGSNRYLGVGTPPVGRYLEQGLRPALGTDSLASNPELSMWREMRLLAEDHPEVDHGDILAMATRNGAGALGLEDDYGTLEPGKKASFLAVPLENTLRDEAEILDYLVTTGAAICPQWIR
jgi:cytosine/adenosine deaminase-related metal-dependent hydrolase